MKQSKSVDCLGLGIMTVDFLFTVDAYPEAGSKIDGSSLCIQGGGPVPNVMVGLSRLGHTTILITAIGNDPVGTFGRQSLCDDGVDDRFVIKKNGTSDTAAGFVESGDGRRTLVLNRDIHVLPRDVKTGALPTPRIVHLDGRDLDACMKLARWGRKVGAKITFDIGSMRNDVSPIFPLVDHLVVADNYAFGFTGAKNVRTAVRRLAAHCPGTIVVTEGIKGSTGFENGKWYRQPAYRVPIVDTTGAGDAFHTGYIYGLLHDYDIARRLAFGAAVAALKCTKMGARAGIPRLQAIRRFLKGEPPKYA